MSVYRNVALKSVFEVPRSLTIIKAVYKLEKVSEIERHKKRQIIKKIFVGFFYRVIQLTHYVKKLFS